MFKRIHEAEGLRVYTHGPLMVTTHRSRITGPQLRGLVTLCHAHLAALPPPVKMSFLSILRGELVLQMDDDVKPAGVELTRATEERSLGQAVVIEAEGFKASTARAVMSGISLLARRKAPQTVVRTVDEGLAWVCALDGQSSDIRGNKAALTRALQPVLDEEWAQAVR